MLSVFLKKSVNSAINIATNVFVKMTSTILVTDLSILKPMRLFLLFAVKVAGESMVAKDPMGQLPMLANNSSSGEDSSDALRTLPLTISFFIYGGGLLAWMYLYSECIVVNNTSKIKKLKVAAILDGSICFISSIVFSGFSWSYYDLRCVSFLMMALSVVLGSNLLCILDAKYQELEPSNQLNPVRIEFGCCKIICDCNFFRRRIRSQSPESKELKISVESASLYDSLLDPPIQKLTLNG